MKVMELNLINKTGIKNVFKISGLKLTIVFSVCFSIIVNSKVWQFYSSSVDIQTLDSILQFFSFYLFVNFLLLSVFILFNFRWLQKSFLIISILISVPAMYFSLSHGIQYDKSMLHNIFETDTKEAVELLTSSFWIIYILLGLIPAIFVYKLKVSYCIYWKQFLQNGIFFLIFIGLACISVFPYFAELSSFVRNNNSQLTNTLLPTSILRSTYQNINSLVEETQIVKEILDPSAHVRQTLYVANRKPLALVVIVGETAREKSFSLNDIGMEDIEESLLNRRNLTYFPNFWSCGTNTALSLPCMFSMFPKSEYKRSMNKRYENVAEIINRVGYNIVWRDNKNGCKGICTNLKVDHINKDNSLKYYNDGKFCDEALIDDLHERISSTKSDQVLILHQLGSHGPAYYKRIPKSDYILNPVCESAEFADCERIEITNSYNNTVLYTKKMIGKAIDTLESLQDDYDTVLIYLSDHGESTGENGLYLHGIPYFMAPDEQTHIPALIWMSDSLISNRQIDMNCMQNKNQQRYSHDNLSHTLLGILNIQTNVYTKSLDLISNCMSVEKSNSRTTNMAE